jgi:hypothetical protein
MRSVRHGRVTLDVEVTNVGLHGIWLLVDAQEHFLPYAMFPWFRRATVGQILDVERPTPEHLRWPELDVDLCLDSIVHPERYPLVSNDRHGHGRAQMHAATAGSGAVAREATAVYGKPPRRRRASSPRRRTPLSG